MLAPLHPLYSNNFPTASNTTDVGYIWFNDSSSVFEAESFTSKDCNSAIYKN